VLQVKTTIDCLMNDCLLISLLQTANQRCNQCYYISVRSDVFFYIAWPEYKHSTNLEQLVSKHNITLGIAVVHYSYSLALSCRWYM